MIDRDSYIRIVFKILLAPVWLILFLLKWTSLIATGIASVVLRLSGMLLLLIGVAYLLLHFEPILTIGAFITPYIASAITGVLEAGQIMIGEFITE